MTYEIGARPCGKKSQYFLFIFYIVRHPLKGIRFEERLHDCVQQNVPFSSFIYT